MQYLQPFRCYLFGPLGHSSDIAARPAEACNKSKFDGIGGRLKNDGNGFGRRLCCQCRRSAARRNHCHLSMNQFSGQRRQAIVMAISPTVLNREVLTIDHTRFTQALPKRCHTIGVGLRRAGTEETYHRHTRLLCARREPPPPRRAADNRDELAPPHSITSSASASSLSGRWRPSAFAIVRLRTSSN